MTIQVLDIFSGTGGLSLGWKKAANPGEVKIVAAIDNDPALAEGFKYNFPESKFILHDFGDPNDGHDADVIARLAEVETGDIDILLAGPPCQTFSAAGKRVLRWDARLVFQVVEIASLLQPKVVLIENVPEFNTASDGRLLGRVRVALSSYGFTTDFRVLNAANFGVPQSRMRSFLLAIRDDLGIPAQILHKSLSFSNRLPSKDYPEAPRLFGESLQPAITVGEALEDLPSIAAGEGSEECFFESAATSDFQKQLRDSNGSLYNHVAGNHSEQILNAMKLLKPGDTPQAIPNHPLRRKEYFRAAYARLHPHFPAPTITTQTHNPGSGRFTHYSDDRVITVREAARLQSFPDSFRFFGTQHSQRRQVGNAVPPILAQHLGKLILGYL